MPTIKCSVLHQDLRNDSDLLVKLNTTLGSFLNMAVLPSGYHLPAEGPLPGGEWSPDTDRSKFKLFYLNNENLYVSTTNGNRDLSIKHTHDGNHYCGSRKVIETPSHHVPRTTVNELISDALKAVIAMRAVNHPEWMLDADATPLQPHELNIPPKVIIKEVIVERKETVVDKSANFRDLALSLVTAAVASSITPVKDKVNKYVLRSK